MTSSLRLPIRLGPALLFGLLAALLIGTEYAIVHRVDFGQHPALPVAVVLDLLLTLPGLFYLCVVRRYRLPLSTLGAVVGLSIALIHWLLPAAGQSLLAWVGRVAVVAEAATLSYAVVRVRRVLRGYRAARLQSADFMDNLEAAVRPVLGSLAGAVATEVAVLRYAALGFWALPEVGPAQVPFSSHRESGFVALLAAFAGLSVLETAAAHLVVGHWWPTVAWVLTASGAYALLWLLAHGQAVRCRPVLLTATALVVRVGLVWRATIPLMQIIDIERVSDVPTPAPGLLNAARLLLTPPNLLLTFAEPQLLRGPYGRPRAVRQLAIYVDEPTALQQQLAARTAAS